MAHSPYESLPPRAFWKTGVSEQTPQTVEDLWRAKFSIGPDCLVATAGSCFAQHIARYLRKRGVHVLDSEPAPPPLDDEAAKRYGYNLYSARYGNIYTVRQLLQLVREALGCTPPGKAVWTKDGRFYDAYRPSVEPAGLASAALVQEHRAQHLNRVRAILESADVFIFTLGLTEAWLCRETGEVFPTAPGTIAGDYDPARYAFKNFSYPEIHADFLEVRELIRMVNPGIKFLLTTSPVPLTATATDSHVLVATTYSKSVLRAVAGQLSNTLPDVDYFPSYEMIASPFSRGAFYEPNLRSIAERGVRSVMRVFFNEPPSATEPETRTITRGARKRTPAERAARRAARAAVPDAADRRDRAERLDAGGRSARRAEKAERAAEEDVVCEDVLLEAFAK